MVIEKTVDATAIIDAAMTLRILRALSGWAGESQLTCASQSIRPVRSI